MKAFLYAALVMFASAAMAGQTFAQNSPYAQNIPQDMDLLDCQKKIAAGILPEGNSPDPIVNCMFAKFGGLAPNAVISKQASVTVNQMKGRPAPPINFYPQPQSEAVKPPVATPAAVPAQAPKQTYGAVTDSSFAGGVNQAQQQQQQSPAEAAAQQQHPSAAPQIYIQSGNSGGGAKPIFLPR